MLEPVTCRCCGQTIHPRTTPAPGTCPSASPAWRTATPPAPAAAPSSPITRPATCRQVLTRMLGHYSAGFTLSTYVHSTPSMRVQAADTIGQMIGREVV